MFRKKMVWNKMTKKWALHADVHPTHIYMHFKVRIRIRSSNEEEEGKKANIRRRWGRRRRKKK
jgi:hypothetical protein